jgi:hypothetical protein
VLHVRICAGGRPKGRFLPRSVSGRVEAWDGKPVRAIVSLEPQKGTTGSALRSIVEKGQRFLFQRVPRGRYKVRADPIASGDESMSMLHEGEVAITVPGATKKLVVVIQEAAVVEGTLMDSAGKPAAGVIVAAYQGKDGSERLLGHLMTKTDGHFRFKLGKGTFLTLKAGPPPKGSKERGPWIPVPDPAKAVIKRGVLAGTKDVILRLR